MTWFSQDSYDIRFEWGPAGAASLAGSAACLVVIDVLSFTTSVSIAVARGMAVYPYPWRDASDFATSVDAVCAVGRSRTSAAHPWSLSPAALASAPVTARLVLPSPNGSAIASAAHGLPVIAASLRNATAVGHWLSRHGYGRPSAPVLVIASGEKWPDGSLRPALEDLLGAGAVIAALGAPASPEATVAAAAFAGSDVRTLVSGCASGRELIESGYASDVALATEVDASDVVPILVDGAFVPA